MVTPMGGKEVRVRVTGALQDDVDVRLIVATLIDARAGVGEKRQGRA
jgi:hypothetical protein